MKVLIGGDFVVTEAYKSKNLIDSSIINLFHNSDYRILNLECPIVQDENKYKKIKTGPYLRSSDETIIPLLKQMDIDLVTLANNHIMDYGAIGLENTIECLESNDIAYTGAGMNVCEAAAPFFIKKNGITVAILNFAENEWSSANEDEPGANPVDVIDNVKQINAAKAKADHVVVIIHGGHEYCHYPSPRMVKQYRFYADNGASAIVGHHTHCIGGYEVFNNVPIIYSLGNFLFTKQSEYNSWYNGLVVTLAIEKEKNISFELQPVEQSREYYLKLSDAVVGDLTLKTVNQYSEVIRSEEKLKAEWLKFVFSRKHQYLNAFNPLNLFRSRKIRNLLIKLKLNNSFMRKPHYTNMLNHIRCEAHYDASKVIIDDYIRDNQKSDRLIN